MAVALEQQVVGHLLRRSTPRRARDRRDARLRGRLVVRRIAEREELVERGGEVGEDGAAELDVFRRACGAGLRVAQSAHALGERQVARSRGTSRARRRDAACPGGRGAGSSAAPPPAARAARRAPAARSAASSSRRHWSGSASFCSSAKVTGRPVAARDLLHPRRARAPRASGRRPARARRGPARRAPGRCRAARRPRRTCPGTGSPSIARWSSVRDVVKPSAPAAIPRARSRPSRRCRRPSPARSSRRARPSRRRARRRAAPARPTSIARGMRSSASRYSGKRSHAQRMPSASAVPGMSSTPSISPISQA